MVIVTREIMTIRAVTGTYKPPISYQVSGDGQLHSHAGTHMHYGACSDGLRATKRTERERGERMGAEIAATRHTCTATRGTMRTM